MRIGGFIAATLLLVGGCSRQFAPPTTTKPPPPLTAMAVPSLVQPRGKAVITISGGTPPYALSLPIADKHSGDGAMVDASAVDGRASYLAGVIGNVSDVVHIRDSHHAEVQVPIAVGEPLAVSPTQVSLSPRQFQSVTVAGGQRPYCFDLATSARECQPRLAHFCGADAGFSCRDEVGDGGPVGPCLDGSGLYRAGSCGSVTDTITVSDDNQVARTVTVYVGPALEVRPSNPEVHPYDSVIFQVTGGVPPYTFDWTAHGDRSDGTLGAGGAYQAGLNPSVVDELRVSDAVGNSTVQHVRVGDLATQLPYGHDYRLFRGDFNGDGLVDLVAVSFDRSPLLALILGNHDGVLPPHLFTLGGTPRTVAIGDINGDGLSDVIIAEADENQPSQLQVLFGRLDGSLEAPLPTVVDNLASAGSVAIAAFPELGGDAGVLALAMRADAGRIEALGLTVGPNGQLTAFRSYQDGLPAALDQAQLVPSPDGLSLVDLGTIIDGGCPGGGVARALALPLDPVRTQDAGLVSDTPLQICLPRHESQALTIQAGQVSGPGIDNVVVDNGSEVVVTKLDFDPTMVTAQTLSAPGQRVVLTRVGSVGTSELDLLSPSGTARITADFDGKLYQRPDSLPGGLADVVSADVYGDGLSDVVGVDFNSELRIFRASPHAHLSVGSYRGLRSPASALAVKDVDGDGIPDLLVPEYDLRIFWGDRSGSLGAGPHTAPGISAIAAVQSGPTTWLLASGLTGQLRAQWASATADGGFAIDQGEPIAVAPDLARELQPLDLGETGAGAALFRGYLQSGRSVLEAAMVVQAKADGGTAVSFPGNQLFELNSGDSTELLLAPVQPAPGPMALVAAENQRSSGTANVNLHLLGSSSPLSWSTTVVSQDINQALANTFSPPTVPFFVTSLYSYPPGPGQPRTRVLVGAAPESSGGFCGSGPTSSDRPRFLVFDVAGGQFNLVGSGDWPDSLDPCQPEEVVPMQSADLDGDGQSDLVFLRFNALQRGESDLLIWPSPVEGGGVVGSIETSGRYLSAFALGDFNGDGRPDIATARFEGPDIDVLLNHGSYFFY